MLTFDPNSFSNTTSLTFIADNPAPGIFQVIANAVEDENSSSEKNEHGYLTRTLIERIRYVSLTCDIYIRRVRGRPSVKRSTRHNFITPKT